MSLISASGGTPAGTSSVVLRSTTPTGVETGAETPPTASPNAASSRGSGAARPDVRSTRAIVVSIGERPSFLASAMKSFAARSGTRSSSALALAARSPASADSRLLICGATSFTGLRPPSWISIALIAWKPNGVRTGSGDISPFFNAKSACSNCGTISPLPTRPRSPPRGAVAGSSEISCASLPKSAPAFARRMTSAILARALSSPSLPPVSGTRTRTWEARTWRGVSNSRRCSL